MKFSKIFGLALAAMSVMTFSACSDDEPNKKITVIELGNTDPTPLDAWLVENYNKPYNIDFKYRYEDIQGDFNYYLIPANYNDAVIMAHLVKHLCIDTYVEVAGRTFTCTYFPKMFYTVGEWEYRNNGTIILGTAEGGRKIFLAGLNLLSGYLGDAAQLNHYYFKTIHHEFTHILNQNKSIPADFQLITGSGYIADMWNEKPFNATYLSNGFISAYSQHSYGEDFAEMLSIYVTNDEAGWNKLLSGANANSKSLINQKLDIVRDYMMTNFNIDIDMLRDVIQRRQQEVVSGQVDLTDVSV
ncbi:MAG: putative zinc-binding metallopeptidase [Muribaculum sp.]|nr:putative zinc-binding metallopeptidase [Muribaculaceae bacterium]MCM1081108.1 putative zinc-binding metallopeptidase [Muribaculum sp.]